MLPIDAYDMNTLLLIYKRVGPFLKENKTFKKAVKSARHYGRDHIVWLIYNIQII